MANAIGLAGWKRGYGNVAAFSKAINVTDLQDENFKRLFINTVHWSARRSNNIVYLCDTENSTFNNLIISTLDAVGL